MSPRPAWGFTSLQQEEEKRGEGFHLINKQKKMRVIAEGISRGFQCEYSNPLSLGYPLSVFNKNSILKQIGFQFALSQMGMGPAGGWLPQTTP